MTGDKGTFAELDGGMIGFVKFGDSSSVDIRSRGTIIFRCQNRKHRALTNVYYIPKLRSSIVNIGQLDNGGCEVLINSGVMRIMDRERRLLAKVQRSRSHLYMLDLKVVQLVCLTARFGHLSFNALKRMVKEQMVRRLPHIKHASEVPQLPSGQAKEAALPEGSQVLCQRRARTRPR
jgi:hypothetical protein